MKECLSKKGHKWKASKSRSVFGLVHIHATLECHRCNEIIPPRVYMASEFERTPAGIHYWFKGDAPGLERNE